jgi:hypothetical protein
MKTVIGSAKLLIVAIVFLLIQGCGGTSSTETSGGGGNTGGSTGNSTWDPRLVTGYPDQNSFSIAAQTFNPEAYNYNNIQVPVFVTVGDRYNNPLGAGTSVNWIAEGGIVGSFCNSDSLGICTVTWLSTGPRPVDGRATVLAWSVGEESFIDVNSNGFYDPADTYDHSSDVGEAFLDSNENGVYDFGEEYFDFNGDGQYTHANGIYNGILCSEGAQAAGMCSPQLVQVQNDIIIVMSGSFINIGLSPSVVDLRGFPSATVRVSLSDDRNQPPPANSKVSVTTTNGDIGEGADFVTPNTYWPGPVGFSFIITGNEDEIEFGYLTVEVTTPQGNITSASIPVYDVVVEEEPEEEEPPLEEEPPVDDTPPSGPIPE